MTKSWQHLRVAVILAVSGAIATATSVSAQSITIDGTLSPAQTLTGPSYTIPQSVGQTVGNNLFQSFGRFNLNMGERANFESAGNIRNILSRVTGGSASMIDGLIFTNSANVNLFLINPSGIVFGPNARLDVGGSTRGSFVATTVDALVWSNGSQFSATNPGGASSLLTIVGDPSGFLSTLRTPPPIDVNRSTLRVSQGQSLLLVGGNVNLDGSNLFVDFTEGGRIELGGVAEPGTLGLNTNANILSLNFPKNLARGNVSLTNGSTLDTRAGNGGSIAINARNIDILSGSRLLTGIGSGSGTVDSQAEDVTLNATGAIRIQGQNSRVENDVNSNATGNSGNVSITSGSFSLRDGAQLSASTFGQGNAGNVTVRALDAVSLADNAVIFSTVGAGGVGKGGNIDINAATLSLIDGAQLQTATRGASATQLAGRGNAGNVNVKVSGVVDIAGEKNGLPSGIFSLVQTGTIGNGGNITLESGSFSLRDGALVSASTFGQGNAGNVTVSATDSVELAGNAGILSAVSAGGVGKGGNIDINAATLSLIDGAQLQTATRGASATQLAGRGDAGNVNVKVTGAVDIAGRRGTSPSGIGSQVQTGTEGNGGNITIDSGSLSLRDGAVVTASTFGQGNAGNVTVSATDSVYLADANIFSTVSAGGVGKGGNIDINAAKVSLIDGAQLQTATSEASATQPAGRGNAGNVNVKVTGAVDIAGEKNGFVSAIGSLVETGTEGNGGNITIDSGSLSLRDGAVLSASTFGQGNAGNVTVSATDSVYLADANIFSRVSAGGVGKGGNIDINAAKVSLIDGAQLQTATSEASATQPAGRGNAGNVNVKVTGAVDIAGEKNGFVSGIRSLVETGTIGNGGNINIDSRSFSLRDDAVVTASTFGQGNAGNVTVSATDSVELAGNAGILSTVSAGGVGKGGNIDINAATLSLIDGAQLATITRGASATQPAGRGDAGNVNVKVTGAVDIAGGKNSSISGIVSFVGTGTEGNGGNITIDSGSFSLRDGAGLEASTLGHGNAGNVTVNALDAVSLAGNAGIQSAVEAGGVGKGGNININAAKVSLIDGAQLQTLTREASDTQPAGRGNAGNVNVTVTGAVDITGEKNGFFSGIGSSVLTGTQGNGGNITIDSGSFSLRDGALLAASTFGQGNAGTIKVNADAKVTISGKGANFTSGLFVNSQSTTGTAGDIIVTSPRVTLDNSGRLNAESASGNGGNINLQSNLLLLRRGGQISTNAGTAPAGGNGGNINIDAGFIVAVPQENSDITANAFSGNGGTVTINAQGIFGIQSRQQPTSQSDITASSTGGGINGVVDINTLDIDPSRGFINLPTNVVDTFRLVAQSCSAFGKGGSEFTVTGRGGLPLGPDDFLSSDVVWSDTRLTALPVSPSPGVTRKVRKTADGVAIVPATGWVFDEKTGEVTLIASNGNSLGVGSNQVKCIVP